MSQVFQNSPVVAQVFALPIEQVLPNPLNPRERMEAMGLSELVASIEAKGIITPLLAARGRGDVVHVVSGHRRRAAAERAGLRELPVIVVSLKEQEQLEVMIVENIQRESLSPLEEARAYQLALDGCPSKSELARRLGVERSRIDLRLALLRMDETTAKIFDRGELPISFARALVQVEDPDERRRMLSLAMQDKTSLREFEGAVRSRREPKVSHACGATTEAPPPRASGESTRADNEGGAEISELPKPLPSAITRSEAVAMLKAGGGPVSFALLRRALKVSCPGCPEEKYPNLCRACPLPAYVAEVVRRAGRAEG